MVSNPTEDIPSIPTNQVEGVSRSKPLQHVLLSRRKGRVGGLGKNVRDHLSASSYKSSTHTHVEGVPRTWHRVTRRRRARKSSSSGILHRDLRSNKEQRVFFSDSRRQPNNTNVPWPPRCHRSLPCFIQGRRSFSLRFPQNRPVPSDIFLNSALS